ncbi:LysM peptidoglycan-binding domain-containing protein [Piscibacillus halophilus]|uniref:LysM peptidoglycan-binding domain-containing protein n=1 Tax=Piscibacillus halophilus TaxID=571933 RepID=UPI00158889B7
MMIEAPVQHFYTVQPGDTIYQLSRRFGVTVENLLAANNISSPNQLLVGQQISVPQTFIHYRVRLGDTVFRIARMFGVYPESIIAFNQLQAPYFIYPNQLLLIPPGLPYYTVQRGDTLFQIARKYNVITNRSINTQLIQEVNQLPNSNIFPGMQLVIPYAPPGGQGLITYNSNHSGTYDLWLYNPNNGSHQMLTQNLTDSFTVPYWSHDRRLLAFVGQHYIVYVLDVNNGQIAQLDQLTPDDILTLDWSPDDQKIVYTKNNQIVIYDVIKHEFQTITKQLPRDAQWFPNGDQLLYSALDSNGNRQMYRANINGGDEQQLTNQQLPVNFLRLSPDGEMALFTSPGVSISIIHTLELDTGNMYSLEGGPLGRDYNPTWSPNSSQIAYSSNDFSDLRGYYSQVKTVGSRGENDQINALSNCFSTPLSWSPDGQSLIYLSGCTEETFANSMWYLNLNHPAPIQLFNVNGVITSMSWSPLP